MALAGVSVAVYEVKSEHASFYFVSTRIDLLVISEPTVSHEAWSQYRRLECLVHRVLSKTEYVGVACEVACCSSRVEIIGQCDSVACGNLENFMLTVAVEGGPLDGGYIGGAGFCACRPIEDHILPTTSDDKLATCQMN